jgi:hypothetical protein
MRDAEYRKVQNIGEVQIMRGAGYRRGTEYERCRICI